MKRKGNFIIGAVFILALAGSLAARFIAGFAGWYRDHIYRPLSAVIGGFFGKVPFSVSELLIYLLIILLLATLIISLHRIFARHRRKHQANPLISWLGGVWLLAGVLFFLYTFLCGINYYAPAFAQQEGFKADEYTAQQLADVCRTLTAEVNRSTASVKRDSAGCLALERGEKEAADDAMTGLGTQYASLNAVYPQPKTMLIPAVLSYQQLTGIYLPFTVEANYNGAMPDYNIPFTACHELSHLRGYMNEEEANFIAFLACIHSERADFQYSGYLNAWEYCMSALRRSDEAAYNEIYPTLSGSTTADLKADQTFLAKYDGRIASVSEQINDRYLKANGRTDGTRSYGRIVDLIIAYYQ